MHSHNDKHGGLTDWWMYAYGYGDCVLGNDVCRDNRAISYHFNISSLSSWKVNTAAECVGELLAAEWHAVCVLPSEAIFQSTAGWKVAERSLAK